MNKKITTSILAALMMAGTTSFTAFAAMSEGTVVIGSKAFDLKYANAPANAEEISDALVTGGAVYVKDFEGNWLDNLTAKVVQASSIPAVIYKSATNQINFDAADKDVVVNEDLNVTSVILNKTTDNLAVGAADTLTSTVSPSNATNKAVTWTSSNPNIATVTNGVVTAVSPGTAIITATTVDGSKTANCSVTVNNSTTKKGYVYNQSLKDDLKVRSAPNLNGTILDVLYNFEKVEILSIDNGWDKIIYNNSVAYVFDEYIQTYTSPSDTAVNTAKKITKQFEVDISNQIAGDFDGQGLSLGYFQWNIRQVTLQPILNRMDREHNAEMKSIFGTNYNIIYDMILDTPENQLTWAKDINDSANKIIEPWYSQFDSLCNNQDFIDIEADAEVYAVKQAVLICEKYNLDSIRGFALAFDIVTQNGSIGPNPTITIDTALEKTPSMAEKDLLGVIANAVADDSGNNSEDVRLRKMAIVNGHGTVHGATLNLDTTYGLSDNSWR
ncbi:Ig domain-containing protein [Clostridium sp.]|uniref:Ig-like domain-containing protein n=1 Tax=Clostridium sp. TaxID=1506 RepID=UPI001A4E7B17|nr:Ig-like domain-containing protein [Clostridium sp.]MBK5235969.1 Ig-like domain-containing protein [Clostridium sp.]